MKYMKEIWPYTKASLLVYDLNFYIDGNIDCLIPNNSQLEGIEFTWQHSLVPHAGLFGV